MTTNPSSVMASVMAANGPRPSLGAGRAFGKVILLGEHAVVYGIPAVAVGIDRGARATITRHHGEKSQLEIPAWQIVVQEGDESRDLGRAFGALLAAARTSGLGALEHGPVHAVAHADLPPGGGLGCSAALGVAVARSLVPRASAEQASELAMAWERVFHGNPSGIDAAVAAHGGSVYFQKGKPIETVPFRTAFTVCLGSTGVSSSTKTMVEGLAQLRDRRRELVDKSFSGILSLVRNARLALEAGDLTAVGKLMDLNQMLLSGLYLSTEEIERLCGLARDSGALGAKLTGAGGGGCVVALAPDPQGGERIVSAWKGAGFDGFTATVSPSDEGSS